MNDDAPTKNTQRCAFSPGPVGPNEQLAYGLLSPTLIDTQTGKLKPEAIKIDDLLGNKGQHVDDCGNSSGLSVARIQKPNAKVELYGVLQNIAERPKKDGSMRKIEGYAIASVDAIEAIENTPLIILDDGCESFTTHAVIRGAPGFKRAALRGARDHLITLFNKHVIQSGSENFT